MSKKKDTELQTAVRITGSAVERMDALAAQRSEPGARVTRADVHRLALYRGLDLLEAESRKSRR